MPDLEIIEKHIQSYISDLENLKKHKNVTPEEIKADKDLLWILERGIYLLIQNLFVRRTPLETCWRILYPPILMRSGIIIPILPKYSNKKM